MPTRLAVLALLLACPLPAFASTKASSLSVSAFVADNPSTCHAWSSATETSAGSAALQVTARCTGPAPYAISLTWAAASTIPSTSPAEMTATAPPPANLPGGAIKSAETERRIISAACDTQECGGMEITTRIVDASLIQVTVLY